jgi:DNA polymerase/3'-5' exonuclease PolX
MAQGREIPFEEAALVAQELWGAIRLYCDKAEIAGSLRRFRPVVHDIDLVVVPKPGQRARLAAEFLLAQDGEPEATWSLPEKIWKFQVKGMPVDVYLATPETFATLLLIRTGSAEHNVLLASRAKRMGLKLRADGSGIEKSGGAVIPCATEDRVFRLLGMRYVEPIEREVGAVRPDHGPQAALFEGGGDRSRA